MPIGEPQAGTAKGQQGVVLTGATIVNTHDGSKTGGMTIAIENGKIAKIDQGAPAGGTATTIDARGKFVVPGYLDMHAHPFQSRDQEGSLNLMLAYGITGVRQMSGSPEMLAARRAGNLLTTEATPELLAMPGMIVMPLNAPTPEAGVAEVRRQKEAGADFIKMVQVTPATFYAVLDEAKRLRLPMAGHIPLGVDVAEAARKGMYAVEHLFGSLEASATDPAALNPSEQGPPRLPPMGEGLAMNEVFERAISNPILIRPPDYAHEHRTVETFSEEKARALASVFVASGIWQVPTLIRLRTMQLGDDAGYRNDPNLRFMPHATRQMWEALAQQFAARISAPTKAMLSRLGVLQIGLVKLFKQAGVKMVAGSDFGGQWCVPGASLHQEFELLSQAGLSPLEILQMTTLNGAKFLGREASMGTVEAGKNADLVLLDADPLAGVQNLKAIHGVVRGGKYYSAATLDDLKKRTEQRHAAA